jgi:hypothetical protein
MMIYDDISKLGQFFCSTWWWWWYDDIWWYIYMKSC